MKKTIAAAVLAACALALPAYAVAKDHPNGNSKPAGPDKGQSGTSHGKSHKCKAHSVGFVASGVLVSDGLTQTAGQQTANDPSDDRYSGTLEVNVTHTNHHAKSLSGDQTLTLTGVRVSFGEGVTQPPAAGGRVHLVGKVTVVAKKCQDKSTAGVVTFKKVTFTAASTDTQQND